MLEVVPSPGAPVRWWRAAPSYSPVPASHRSILNMAHTKYHGEEGRTHG
jgi:hypothetical protein